MSANAPLPNGGHACVPPVLPLRERSRVLLENLRERLRTILPQAMRAAGIDMWILLCQEDDLEPVYTTMIPMDTWCPILQMLAFVDTGEGVEGINISGTDTADLYSRPYAGELPEEQWPRLSALVRERNPKRIGINIGSIEWAAGGLTHNLHTQLLAALPPGYGERLVSAEPAATAWLANLTDSEVTLFEHVVDVNRALIAECYSPTVIVPGVTTTEDIRWHYWQRAADLGLTMAFRPAFRRVRPLSNTERWGDDDAAIRPGDFVYCDVGVKYMRLNTDHKQWVYVRRPGETDAPEGPRRLLAEANRLEDIYMSEFRHGRTGNEMLASILARARDEGVPSPRVYSHSLGYYLHEPGPLIGLPWEQERCEGRGDVALDYNNAFTMEISVEDAMPGWPNDRFRLMIEEDVVFTREGCRPVGGVQTAFYLV